MTTLAGWVALLCLPVALLSGAVVGWFYVPDPAAAHATLVELESVVPGGAWLRSLHAISSHAALGLGLLHLLGGVLRRERRATSDEDPVVPASSRAWSTGLVALAVLGLLAFTGRALPWDQHAGLSLQMADRFLRAGDLQPVRWLLGPMGGPLLLQRVWLLHLGLAVALALALAGHGSLRARLREWTAAPRTGRRAIAVTVGALGLLVGAGLVHRPPLGHPASSSLVTPLETSLETSLDSAPALLDGAERSTATGAERSTSAGVERSASTGAEWYLRWLQFLSVRAGAAAPLALGLLALVVAFTPLLHRKLGPRGLRLIWAGVLSTLTVLSLLP